VLEKMEISEDEDDGFEYKEIKDSDGEQIEDYAAVESLAEEDDDDLNDFTALKTKTEMKKMAAGQTERGAKMVTDALPKTLSRDVVIDDFIRNFM
jgi:hypothetical protein